MLLGQKFLMYGHAPSTTAGAISPELYLRVITPRFWLPTLTANIQIRCHTVDGQTVCLYPSAQPVLQCYTKYECWPHYASFGVIGCD